MLKSDFSCPYISKILLQENNFKVSSEAVRRFRIALDSNPGYYATLRINEFDKIIDAVEKHAKAILVLDDQIEKEFKASQESGERSKTLPRDLQTFSELIKDHIFIKQQLGLIGNDVKKELDFKNKDLIVKQLQANRMKLMEEKKKKLEPIVEVKEEV